MSFSLSFRRQAADDKSEQVAVPADSRWTAGRVPGGAALVESVVVATTRRNG